VVIRHESQFAPAGNDVLIKFALLECALSGQMMLSRPSYKHLTSNARCMGNQLWKDSAP